MAMRLALFFVFRDARIQSIGLRVFWPPQKIILKTTVDRSIEAATQ
jgi:hypothetical protein